MLTRNRLAITALALCGLTSLHAGLAMMYSDTSVVAALRYGLVTGSVMCLLMLGLWSFSKRVPWPTPLRVAFLLKLWSLGFAFGTVFHGFDRTLTALRTGVPPLGFVFSAPNPIWDILLWAFLGTTVLILFYGVRGHDEAHFHRLAAAEANAVAVQAKLDTLRGQLNPHLIQNALHSVMVLTQRDPVAARAAISNLGDLLRYTLAAGRSWDVPLREEWRFTESYLAIEKMRLGEKLEVRSEIEAGAVDQLIPRFTLQPLVENAVRHGVSKRPAGGRVIVRARHVDGALLLEVENPNATRAASEDDTLGNGVALTNLATRLRLRLGDEASLALETDQEVTIARVFIPTEGVRWTS